MLDGKKVISYMRAKGYEVRAVNLVGIEGMNADGSLNSDQLDLWNDVVLVIRDTGEILVSAVATTEPGRYYTKNRMNPRGAARLAIGQHKDAWAFGYHNYDKSHPALVQVGPVTVHRDNNADGFRTADVTDVGLFGVNIHGTLDRHSANSVGRWSAGCVVSRDWPKHLTILKFMRDSGRPLITFTLLDGTDFYKLTR